MHDAGGVQDLETTGDVVDERHHLGERKAGAVAEQRREVAALEQLHGDVRRPVLGVADLDHVDQVGPPHATRHLRLAQEATHQLRLLELAEMEQLHRHAIGALTDACRIHLAHRASPDDVLQAEAPRAGAGVAAALPRARADGGVEVLLCLLELRLARASETDRLVGSLDGLERGPAAEASLPQHHEHRRRHHAEHGELRGLRGAGRHEEPEVRDDPERDEQRRAHVLKRDDDRQGHDDLRVFAEAEEREPHHDDDSDRRKDTQVVDEHHRRHRRRDAEDAEDRRRPARRIARSPPDPRGDRTEDRVHRRHRDA